MNCVLIGMLPTQSSLIPYSLRRKICWSLLHFGTFIHGFALCNVFTHGRVWHHIPLNIYNLNSRLAHFNVLWICVHFELESWRNILWYSQGTYVQIEQTSEAIRVTYEMCRVGGDMLELRNHWFIQSSLPSSLDFCFFFIKKLNLLSFLNLSLSS